MMKLPSFFNRVKSNPIKAPTRYFGMSGGTYVGSESSMQSSAFYRGVIYLSSQLAKLPWEVKDKEHNILDNDISALLNVSPNDEMNAFHFKLLMIQTAIIEGNGYAEIERGFDGRALALWPLDYGLVSPKRDAQNRLYYEVRDGSMSGDSVVIAPKDMFVFRNLHTVDGFQGLGVVAYAKTVLGISLGADKFANGLFANGGMPSGVLHIDKEMSPEAYERLKDSWKQMMGGKNTGATAILEDGVKYLPISHSPDVLQFLESRKFAVTEQARFLGIPPQKLFDTDSSKYSNMEQAQLEVATDTLDSWCRNLEAEADVKLMQKCKGGKYTELDLAAIYRGDTATRTKYYTSMVSISAMTPNEVRGKEGLPPREGGDRFVISTNNYTPVDRWDDVIDATIEKKASSTTPKEDEPEETEVDKAAAAFLKSMTK